MKKISLIFLIIVLLLSLTVVACHPTNVVKSVYATYEVLPDGFDNLDDRINSTVSSLRRLLLDYGFSKLTVTKGKRDNGNPTIRVSVQESDDVEKVFDLISRPASLEFKAENDKNAKSLMVGREHLEKAYVTKDAQDNYAVGLKFNEKGTEKFAQLTNDYLNESIYIFIDGELYTTVIVNSQITDGTAIITRAGGYTYVEAKEFATKLQVGAFGVTLSLYSVLDRE